MLFKIGEQAILFSTAKGAAPFNGKIVTVTDIGPFDFCQRVPSRPLLFFMRNCDYGVVTQEGTHGGVLEKELFKLDGYQETDEESQKEPFDVAV